MVLVGSVFSIRISLIAPPDPPLEKSRDLPSSPSPVSAVRSIVTPPVDVATLNDTAWLACPLPVPLTSGLLTLADWWRKFSDGTATAPNVFDSPDWIEELEVVVLRDICGSLSASLSGECSL